MEGERGKGNSLTQEKEASTLSTMQAHTTFSLLVFILPALQVYAALLSGVIRANRFARFAYPSVSLTLRDETQTMVRRHSDQHSDRTRLSMFQGKKKLRPWFKCLKRENSDHSEKLKKAVVVSEEKIQERSSRRVRFSSSNFPCSKVPRPWQRQHFVLLEHRGKFSQQRRSKFAGKPFQQGIRIATAFSSFLRLWSGFGGVGIYEGTLINTYF